MKTFKQYIFESAENIYPIIELPASKALIESLYAMFNSLYFKGDLPYVRPNLDLFESLDDPKTVSNTLLHEMILISEDYSKAAFLNAKGFDVKKPVKPPIHIDIYEKWRGHHTLEAYVSVNPTASRYIVESSWNKVTDIEIQNGLSSIIKFQLRESILRNTREFEMIKETYDEYYKGRCSVERFNGILEKVIVKMCKSQRRKSGNKTFDINKLIEDAQINHV